MTKRVNVRNKLKNIKKSDFEKILSELMITEDQRTMMKMIYFRKKSQSYVADLLHVSVTTIKWWHSVIIDMIVVNGLLEDVEN